MNSRDPVVWFFRFVALLPLALVAAGAGILVGDRSPPVVRISGVIVPPDPEPGTRVRVIWQTEVHRVCTGAVRRKIVDSTGTVWTMDVVEAEYGKEHDLVRSFVLPVSIAWGPARYTATVSYRCHFLHDFWPITVTGPDVEFNIAKPPPCESCKHNMR